MQINAKITGIQYQILLTNVLEKYNIEEFDVNTCPASCLIIDKQKGFAISKWVSPKRTRSYPYERVYNTLSYGKKITVIPVIKDEGFDGDRDFIQWDTISMMSLLDVYVILAYYNSADKNENYKNKITNQKFDNEYVLEKIREISNYHSSALHWNLQELNQKLSETIAKAKSHYNKMSNAIGVKMHHEKGIDRFQKIFNNSLHTFMEFSRQKAKEAQNREFVTLQPKESLQSLTKSKITITNYLGGQYFLTVDEIKIEMDNIYLIEAKHSQHSLLPSQSDIKDGLLKMILYSNLVDVEANGEIGRAIPVLLLTSTKLRNNITSNTDAQEIESFYIENQLNDLQQKFINILFSEANKNSFIVILQNG